MTTQLPAASLLLIGSGCLLWIWGSIPLLIRKKQLLFRIHTLTVADTLGSILIVIGLIIERNSEWPLLCLGLLSIILWNATFSIVLSTSAFQRNTDLHRETGLLNPDGGKQNQR
ncbi:MAG: monovalent cation/H(+) antiporter subunit G [Prochlorococcus sp.]